MMYEVEWMRCWKRRHCYFVRVMSGEWMDTFFWLFEVYCVTTSHLK
jgi:hypothetical protein